MEFNQESNEQSTNEEVVAESSQFKQWLQDNLRIIVSILIVVIIAGGVYSYSKRTEAPTISEEENVATIEENEKGSLSEGASTEKETSAKKTEKETASPAATSQETESSFVETAIGGDSRTTLARKALANYLEKNPDSTLTVEHKIYIEDFLRKNVSHSGGVSIGTSVEFSKSLIENAITKSKTLNDNQLQNLHKYAVRVPSLS